jgi:DNA-binding NarL/FixJ family response regulator
MDSLKIIVADDHPLFREGLVQALLRIHSYVVDLIFIDIRMPGRDGIEITRCIRKFNTHVKIVVVSMIDDRGTVQKVFKAGANGYLHKNTDKSQIKKVIDAVMHQETYLSEEIAIYRNDLDLSDHSLNTYSQYDVLLSEREIEILQLICNQYSSKEIGQRLKISEKTIEGHRFRLMLKTHSKNVAGLIMYAVENGYISSDHKK